MGGDFPVLKRDSIFRKGEHVYINRSDELEQFCGIIHKHDFIEIAYVIKGSGIHFINGSQYKTSKGDFFIINYDTPHGFFPINKNSPDPVVYNCAFLPGFLDSSLFSSHDFRDITSSFLFKSLFPDNYRPGPDLKLKGVEFSEIGSLFSKMYSEYKLKQDGYCDIIRAYLIEMVVKVFRYMRKSRNEYPAGAKNMQLVQKAVDYLKENLNSDIKLEDLAMKSFISKNYFSRLFREITGISFSDYIQRLRVDEACALLETTDMKITEIAHRSGFNDIKFFYKVFRKITGLTPGEYRKSMLYCSHPNNCRDAK